MLVFVRFIGLTEVLPAAVNSSISSKSSWRLNVADTRDNFFIFLAIGAT
jgi:hypothetical protein